MPIRILKKDEDTNREKGLKKSKMLTGGQAKIAAKAPPPNKIDEKDFAVLRAEKAKGRGMGLQDEKVKPGKVQKAALGLAFMKKAKDKGAKGAEFLSPIAMAKRMFNKKAGGVMKYKRGMGPGGLDLPVISSVKPTVNKTKRSQNLARMKEQFNKQKSRMGKNPNKTLDSPKAGEKFLKRRKELSVAGKVISATKVGKMLLPVVAAGVAGQQYLKSKMKKKDVKKKMGGGMMKKYSSGGESSYTKGYAGRKTGKGVRESLNDKVTPMKKERLLAGLKASGKMGGGMMQRPMGYKIGTGKKPLETAMNKKRAEQTKNVKRLTTESDAYDPERRILHASKKTRSGSTNTVRVTTDQVNLKEARNKFKSELPRGYNIRIKTPEEMRPRRSMGKLRRSIARYSKGVMVKARGCKLGRNKPTKIT